MIKTNPISLEGLKSYPLKKRESKVSTGYFALPWKQGGSMRSWIRSLSGILAAKDFLNIRDAIITAVKSKKLIIFGMGAHVIKVGLSPIVIDLMERGIIGGLALNGAGIIHDSEIAMAGKTSEDVASRIGDGRYGMAEETGRYLNEAIIQGAEKGIGLGSSIGRMLVSGKYPYNKYSIVARAHELNIPVTVHVAIGTDTIHFHPKADGASIGKTSHTDFRIFADILSKMEGGVFINIGSAVIIPEVFLKALTLVRNLGHEINNITTVNMDFKSSYRPLTNVVQRPTLEGGKGYSIIGHHEIMVPLLAAAVIDGLE